MSPKHYISNFSNNTNIDPIMENSSINNKFNNYNFNNQSINSNNNEENTNYTNYNIPNITANLSKESPKEMILTNNPIFNSTELKVGVLTVEERKLKIEKYLRKKRKRTWNRKINYFCRKQVADKRLRLKGRLMKKPKQDSFSALDRTTY